MPRLISATRAADAPITRLHEEWGSQTHRTHALPFLRPGWVGAGWRAFGVGRPEIQSLRKGGRLVGALLLARADRRAPVSAMGPKTRALAAVTEGTDATRALVDAAFEAAPRFCPDFLAEGVEREQFVQSASMHRGWLGLSLAGKAWRMAKRPVWQSPLTPTTPPVGRNPCVFSS